MIDHSQWWGYFAASPTPFTADGSIDYALFEELIAWFLSNKPQGFVANGTTGEWYAQDTAERIRIAEVAREHVPTDTPLLIGINSILPSETIELGNAAASIGVDGVLVSLPPSRRFSQQDIETFYAHIAASIDLPILIYNLPGYVGVDLTAPTLQRLLVIDGIVGVKDNTPSASNRVETLKLLGKDHAIFSDVLEPSSAEVFKQGYGRGQIGSAMPLGAPLAEAFADLAKGNTNSIDELVTTFSRFKQDITAVIEPGLPWHFYIKLLMKLSGTDAGHPRFPATLPGADSPIGVALENVLRTFNLAHCTSRVEHPTTCVSERNSTMRMNYFTTADKSLPALFLGTSLGAEASMWDEQIERLQHKYFIVRFELRGHGKSPLSPDTPTIDDFADDVIAIADELGIDTFAYCGLSIGGAIGQSLAARYPNRLTSLVLSSTGLTILSAPMLEERAQRVMAEGTGWIADASATRWFADGFRAAQPDTVEQQMHHLRTMDPQGYAHACLALSTFNGHTLAPSIVTPTLVIAGDEDIATSAADGEALAAAIPGATFAVLKGAAHLCNVEQPEEFSKLVDDHIQASSS